MSLQLTQQYFIDRSAEDVFHAYNKECRNEYSLIESFKNDDGYISDENFSRLKESGNHILFQQKSISVLPVNSRHDQVTYVPAYKLSESLNCTAIELEIYEGYYITMNLYVNGHDELSLSVNWDTADYQVSTESPEFTQFEAEVRKLVDVLHHSDDDIEFDEALDNLHSLIDDGNFLFEKFGVTLYDLINPNKDTLQTAVVFN